jgi:hypothetical protein
LERNSSMRERVFIIFVRHAWEPRAVG